MLTKFINENYNEMLDIIRDLCKIPAPSHGEAERARFCKAYLDEMGCEGVYIDGASNVIFPYFCGRCDSITVFAAHTDTVFPDTVPYPYSEDKEKIYCPGVGDNTASMAVLMTAAKYFTQNKIKPSCGILFVLNSCEEGLGNLKGTRALFDAFGHRIKRFVSLDCFSLGDINNSCVGSHRYEVEVKTEGGHSFENFGRKNAICALSEIIGEIYKIDVPKNGNSVTTYNVGTIEGGTSVNTIAQSAKMLCEYRSDSAVCLDIMKKKFYDIFESAKGDEVTVEVRKIGDRPCENGVAAESQRALAELCKGIMERVTGREVTLSPASTDCNVPLSMGIPAVCIGVYNGGGQHTRQEYMEKASLIPGLEIALGVALSLSR